MCLRGPERAALHCDSHCCVIGPGGETKLLLQLPWACAGYLHVAQMEEANINTCWCQRSYVLLMHIHRVCVGVGK